MPDEPLAQPATHPMPWHRSAWQQVLSQLHNGRLAHAYLISGLAGSGRHQFVQALCALLSCEHHEQTNQACGKCRQCLLFASGNYPDLLEIEPEEGSSVIKIDQVRRLTEQVQQTSSQQGRFKLIVLRPAEALGPGAANALLKILEEPPGNTLFLLINESGSQLLPTIRSRCQPIHLPSPDRTQTQRWLSQMSAAEPDMIAAAAELAPHSPRRALQLLETGVAAWREVLIEQLHGLTEGRDSVTAVARFCEKQPFEHAITLVLELCLARIRTELSRSRYAASVETQNEVLTDDQQQILWQQNLNRCESLEAWFGLYHDTLRLYRQLNSSANPNLLMSFEYLMIRWQEVSAGKWQQSTAPGY